MIGRKKEQAQLLDAFKSEDGFVAVLKHSPKAFFSRNREE